MQSEKNYCCDVAADGGVCMCEEDAKKHIVPISRAVPVSDVTAKKLFDHEHVWADIPNIPKHLQGGPTQACSKCGTLKMNTEPVSIPNCVCGCSLMAHYENERRLCFNEHLVENGCGCTGWKEAT